MQILNNPNFKFSTLLKILGVSLLAVIVLVFALRLVGTSLKSVFNRDTSGLATVNSSLGGFASPNQGGAMGLAPQLGYDYDSKAEVGEASDAYGVYAPELSIRNIAPWPPVGGGTVGADAEAFEITDYRVRVETGNLEPVCQTVAALKDRPEVIFENANENERGCYYTFKVENAQADEILTIIKELDPQELTESSYTIKNIIEDYTDELAVLENKRVVIESTLSDAINSYDEIARVATSARDANALASIIDSKIRIIERLTQEKININTQIDHLSRSKLEQLDRLEYVYFNIAIVENKYLDGQALQDSWRQAVREFVRDVNDTLQDASVNLLALLLRGLLVVLYLLIILVAAKYAWRFAKSFWQK